MMTISSRGCRAAITAVVLLSVLGGDRRAQAAAPACDLQQLGKLLAAGGEVRLEVSQAPGAPVIVRATRAAANGGKPGVAMYAMVFAEGDIHTSMGARNWPDDAARALQKQLDAAAGTEAVKTQVRQCTGGLTPAALGPALDAALRDATRPPGSRDRARAEKPSAPQPEGATAQGETGGSPLTRVYFGLLPWLWVALFAALGVAAVAAARAAPRFDLGVLAGLTAVAVLLRAVVAHDGPGDIFNSMGLSHASGDPIHGFGFYGQGPPALLWLLEDLGIPQTDALLMRLSLVAGVVSVPLLFALARTLGRRRTEAHVAAALLTLAPLHIHFSAVYHRYAIFVALGLAGLVLMARFVRRDERSSAARAADGVGAVTALALAVQCRPESVAWLGIAGGLAAVLALRGDARRGVDWPRVGVVFVGVALCAAVPVAETLQAAMNEALRATYVDPPRPLFDPAHNSWLNPALTPLPWLLLSLLGLVLARRRDRWYLAWLAVAALGWSWLVAAQSGDEDRIIYARHQLGALPFYVLLAAAGAQRLVDVASDRVAIPLLGVAMAAAIPPVELVTRQHTVQQEYAFYREALPLVPDGCVIVAFEPGPDAGLRPPVDLGRELGIAPPRWVAELPAGGAASGCVAYVHTSGCVAQLVPEDEARRDALCGTRELAGFRPVLERTLTVVEATGSTYEGVEEIPVGLYVRGGPKSP